MELINKKDAVALIRAEMDKIRTHSLVDGTARINLRLAKNIIENMPNIDIVRCKECKHRETCEQMVVFENGKYITSGYKLDYCSHGEREGE